MRAFGVAIFIPGGEQALLMELFCEKSPIFTEYINNVVGVRIFSCLDRE
jgi:hypothetical protein